MSVLTDLLDFGAAKKASKAQARTAAETARKDGIEFDSRLASVRQSDTRLDDLSRAQYGDMSGLEDSTFDWMLNNNQTGFNEQTTIAGKAFDDQMTALGGLMTSKRQARLQAAAKSEEERQRQLAFQSRADGLAEALPEDIGFNAQQVGMADALSRRTAATRAAVTGPETPYFAAGADPTLARAFEGQQQRGYGEALTEADAGSKVASYSDAFVGSERKLGDFATAIGDITNKAAISRSALPYELNVSAVDKRNAQEDYESEVDLVDRSADRRGRAVGDYRENNANAQQQYSQNWGSALEDYFGKQFGTEGTYVDRLMGSSTNYSNKVTSLGNYKMQNTTASNPLSSLIKTAERAFASAMAAKGGG